MSKLHAVIFSVGLLAGTAAHAQLKIEIAGISANQIPIAVAMFADEGVAPADVSDIIRADLERSGIFKVIDGVAVLSETAIIDHAQWKTRGADALVVGSVQKLTPSRANNCRA